MNFSFISPALSMFNPCTNVSCSFCNCQVKNIPPPKKKTKKNKTKRPTKFQNSGNLEFSTGFCFSNFESNDQIWIFWVNKYELSYHNKILAIPNFEGADFKSDIDFWKFQTQASRFGHFKSKSINFLFLAKFRIYPISNMLISNLTLTFENF